MYPDKEADSLAGRCSLQGISVLQQVSLTSWSFQVCPFERRLEVEAEGGRGEGGKEMSGQKHGRAQYCFCQSLQELLAEVLICAL